LATFPRLAGQITDEAYAARQKLVVLPTDELRNLLKAFDLAPVFKDDGRVKGVAATSAALAAASVDSRRTAAPFLLGGVIAAGLQPSVLRQIRRHWRRWRTAAKLDLGVVYTDTDSAANLRFPAGHPVHNLLYIAHPTDPGRYLVAAQFHRNAFDDKLAEAIGLLQALGAKKMTVHHVTGWKDDVSLSLGSEGIEQVAVDAKIERSKGADSTVLFEAEYDPVHEPSLPSELHWFHDEPLWKKLAEGRLHANLRTFSLDVTYQQDFGIDTNLPVKVNKAGFKLAPIIQ